MIETDERVKATLTAVRKRPEVDTKEIVRDAIRLLHEAPSPRPSGAGIISVRKQLWNGRSQLIDKRITLLRELAQLRGARDDLTDYLYTNYRTTYLGNVKNREIRRHVVNRALAPLLRRIRKLESALEVVLAVLEDYKDRSFDANGIASAIKIGEYEGQ